MSIQINLGVPGGDQEAKGSQTFYWVMEEVRGQLFTMGCR